MKHIGHYYHEKKKRNPHMQASQRASKVQKKGARNGKWNRPAQNEAYQLCPEKCAMLPREGFFEEVDVRNLLLRSYGTSDLIADTAVAADLNRNVTKLVLNLHIKESVEVCCISVSYNRSGGGDWGLTSTREHLNGGRWTMDFLRRLWSGDKKHDPENVATLLHRKNLSHPGTDPLKMLWIQELAFAQH